MPFTSDTPINTEQLLITQDDYIRLRTLGEGHELSSELDRAIVVPPERMTKDVVTMHSSVLYVDENSGIRREITLVYPEEANPTIGQISVLAPVGSALLGLSVGRSIDWAYPDGNIHRLRIERVLPQHNSPQWRPSAE